MQLSLQLKGKVFNTDLKFKMSSKKLLPSHHVKYLGVYIHEYWNWSTFVNQFCVKLIKANVMLLKIDILLMKELSELFILLSSILIYLMYVLCILFMYVCYLPFPSILKVVSATFLLICFACLKESSCEIRKKSFFVHFENSICSWDNQI